jgi:peptide-methionine (S)-S-oxide reductase
VKKSNIIYIGLAFLTLLGCAQSKNGVDNKSQETQENQAMENLDSLEQATLGAGCFWCVEAVFEGFKGVAKVESGYAGGTVENPTYKEVCTGQTGHAEVARIWFDPAVISYEQLLDVFWHSHDPTTKNRQGNDVGTQYRSVIYYHNDEQKQIAEKSKKEADEAGIWPNPIVTEIEVLPPYYPAENYHQNYFKYNSSQPYCAAVIAPKLRKVRAKYADLLKE